MYAVLCGLKINYSVTISKIGITKNLLNFFPILLIAFSMFAQEDQVNNDGETSEPVLRTYSKGGFVNFFGPASSLTEDGNVVVYAAYGALQAPSIKMGEGGNVDREFDFLDFSINSSNQEDSGCVVALRPSGTKLVSAWDFTLPATCVGVSVGADGTIYAGTVRDTSSKAYLYAITPSPVGEQKWKSSPMTSDIQAAPAIGKNGAIYVCTRDGYLWSVNPDDGKEVWRLNIMYGKKRLGGITSPPVIDKNGDIYLCTRIGYLVKVRPPEGGKGEAQFMWETECGPMNNSSPAIGDDGTIYVCSTNGCLYAVTHTGGKILWKFDSSKGIGNKSHPIGSSPVIGRNGTIYVGSMGPKDNMLFDGCIYVVKPPQGSSADPSCSCFLTPDRGIVSPCTPALGYDHEKKASMLYFTSHEYDKDSSVFTGVTLYSLLLNEEGEPVPVCKKIFSDKSENCYCFSPTILPDGCVWVGVGGNIHSIPCDFKVMDPASPWPKYHGDMNASGGVGSGQKMLLSDQEISVKAKTSQTVTVNDVGYKKLIWWESVEKNKAKIKIKFMSSGKEWTLIYDPDAKKSDIEDQTITIKLAATESGKWIRHEVDIQKDIDSVIPAGQRLLVDKINTITFTATTVLGKATPVKYKNAMLTN